MSRLFKKSRKYNVAKNSLMARIVLLDGTSIDINLQPDVTGADCLERVSQCMEITEIDYFGLQYHCKDGYTRWVDRDKSLRKQLEKYHIDGARNAELRFYVQFYVTNVTKLDYEVTKYLYFLQLKYSVITGHLSCNNELACKLASYALQAEFGDYDETQHTNAFLDDCILFPPTIEPASLQPTLIDRVSKLYQRHRGISAASAELMYIKLAQQLPEYGHEPLQQLDISGSKIWIGACFIGVFIKHSNGQPTVYFKWPEILRMKCKDRNFGIETFQETVYFKLADSASAQYVLRMMVQQHMFFRTEYEYVKWTANGHNKKKSTSLHDIRSHSLFGSASKKKKTNSVRDQDLKEMKPRKFSRPLGKPVQKDKYIDPLAPPVRSPARQAPMKISDGLLTEDGLEVTVSPGIVGEGHRKDITPSAWQDDEADQHRTAVGVADNKKQPMKIKGLSRSKVIETIDVEVDTIDIGEPLANHLITASPPSTQSPQNSQPTTTSTPIQYINGGQHIMGNGGMMDNDSKDRLSAGHHYPPQPSSSHNHHNSTASDGRDTSGGSHESINLLKDPTNTTLGGSLDNINQTTPQRPLVVRDYGAEQWEKNASSGTRDKRGQSLEEILSSGGVFAEFEEIHKTRMNPVLSSANSSSLSGTTDVKRNRYKDILPYEDTRVVLNAANNVSNNDYINASHVEFDTGGYKHRYIVAQGPLEATTGEFWQMVWEQNVQLILMLTNIFENGKAKCHQYYPSDEDKMPFVQFEQYRISQRFLEESKTTISRGLIVKYIPTGEEREITQMQYIDWPDHGIPEDPQPFIDFLRAVQSLRQPSSCPVVVHCSAGVGRSGVLVLVDMLMGQYDSGEPINIPQALQKLRYQRMHLVQTLGQYKFVYEVLIHYIKTARLI